MMPRNDLRIPKYLEQTEQTAGKFGIRPDS